MNNLNQETMKIEINDNRKIYAIQEEFNTAYPYLKLEFFKKPHKKGGASPKEFVTESSKLIGQCRTIHNSGEITITPHLTVGELEEHFSSVYGLSVQVFRKSGKVWLETTETDNWSLQKQNDEGQELSKTKLL